MDDEKEEGQWAKEMGALPIDNFIEKIRNELKNNRKISPILVMKKYRLSEDMATKVCQNIWLNQHLEARKMALGIEI